MNGFDYDAMFSHVKNMFMLRNEIFKGDRASQAEINERFSELGLGGGRGGLDDEDVVDMEEDLKEVGALALVHANEISHAGIAASAQKKFEADALRTAQLAFTRIPMSAKREYVLQRSALDASIAASASAGNADAAYKGLPLSPAEAAIASAAGAALAQVPASGASGADAAVVAAVTVGNTHATPDAIVDVAKARALAAPAAAIIKAHATNPAAAPAPGAVKQPMMPEAAVQTVLQEVLGGVEPAAATPTQRLQQQQQQQQQSAAVAAAAVPAVDVHSRMSTMARASAEQDLAEQAEDARRLAQLRIHIATKTQQLTRDPVLAAEREIARLRAIVYDVGHPGADLDGSGAPAAGKKGGGRSRFDTSDLGLALGPEDYRMIGPRNPKSKTGSGAAAGATAAGAGASGASGKGKSKPAFIASALLSQVGTIQPPPMDLQAKPFGLIPAHLSGYADLAKAAAMAASAGAGGAAGASSLVLPNGPQIVYPSPQAILQSQQQQQQQAQSGVNTKPVAAAASGTVSRAKPSHPVSLAKKVTGPGPKYPPKPPVPTVHSTGITRPASTSSSTPAASVQVGNLPVGPTPIETYIPSASSTLAATPTSSSVPALLSAGAEATQSPSVAAGPSIAPGAASHFTPLVGLSVSARPASVHSSVLAPRTASASTPPTASPGSSTSGAGAGTGTGTGADVGAGSAMSLPTKEDVARMIASAVRDEAVAARDKELEALKTTLVRVLQLQHMYPQQPSSSPAAAATTHGSVASSDVTPSAAAAAAAAAGPQGNVPPAVARVVASLFRPHEQPQSFAAITDIITPPRTRSSPASKVRASATGGATTGGAGGASLDGDRVLGHDDIAAVSQADSSSFDASSSASSSTTGASRRISTGASVIDMGDEDSESPSNVSSVSSDDLASSSKGVPRLPLDLVNALQTASSVTSLGTAAGAAGETPRDEHALLQQLLASATSIGATSSSSSSSASTSGASKENLKVSVPAPSTSNDVNNTTTSSLSSSSDLSSTSAAPQDLSTMRLGELLDLLRAQTTGSTPRSDRSAASDVPSSRREAGAAPLPLWRASQAVAQPSASAAPIGITGGSSMQPSTQASFANNSMLSASALSTSFTGPLTTSMIASAAQALSDSTLNTSAIQSVLQSLSAPGSTSSVAGTAGSATPLDLLLMSAEATSFSELTDQELVSFVLRFADLHSHNELDQQWKHAVEAAEQQRLAAQQAEQARQEQIVHLALQQAASILAAEQYLGQSLPAPAPAPAGASAAGPASLVAASAHPAASAPGEVVAVDNDEANERAQEAAAEAAAAATAKAEAEAERKAEEEEARARARDEALVALVRSATSEAVEKQQELFLQELQRSEVERKVLLDRMAEQQAAIEAARSAAEAAQERREREVDDARVSQIKESVEKVLQEQFNEVTSLLASKSEEAEQLRQQLAEQRDLVDAATATSSAAAAHYVDAIARLEEDMVMLRTMLHGSARVTRKGVRRDDEAEEGGEESTDDSSTTTTTSTSSDADASSSDEDEDEDEDDVDESVLSQSLPEDLLSLSEGEIYVDVYGTARVFDPDQPEDPAIKVSEAEMYRLANRFSGARRAVKKIERKRKQFADRMARLRGKKPGDDADASTSSSSSSSSMSSSRLDDTDRSHLSLSPSHTSNISGYTTGDDSELNLSARINQSVIDTSDEYSFVSEVASTSEAASSNEASGRRASEKVTASSSSASSSATQKIRSVNPSASAVDDSMDVDQSSASSSSSIGSDVDTSTVSTSLTARLRLLKAKRSRGSAAAGGVRSVDSSTVSYTDVAQAFSPAAVAATASTSTSTSTSTSAAPPPAAAAAAAAGDLNGDSSSESARSMPTFRNIDDTSDSN